MPKINLNIVWDTKLPRKINKIHSREDGDLIVIVYDSLKHIALFDLSKKAVVWEQHLSKNSVVSDVIFFGKWVLVNYGGGQDAWMRYSIEDDDSYELSDLEYTDTVVYKTSQFLVFGQDYGDVYISFNSLTGELESVDEAISFPYAAAGSSERFVAWHEEDGESKIMVGDIDASTGAPLKEGVEEFMPEDIGKVFRVGVGNERRCFYVLDEEKKVYGWFTWDRECVSIFEAPECVSSEHSFIEYTAYSRDGIDYVILYFTTEGGSVVEVCNYNADSGELIWQKTLKRGFGSFALVGDYLVQAFGTRLHGDTVSDPSIDFTSHQIDLATGEMQTLIDEPVGSWLCRVGRGLLFNRYNQKGASISYGEFCD